MGNTKSGILAAKRAKGRMGLGPWDDKPGAGRMAPLRREPRFPSPPRTRGFWGGVWIGLSLGLTVGLAAGYGLVIWCLSQVL